MGLSRDVASAVGDPIGIPDYLRDAYWWAYVHPRAVRLFERQWLVNLILWGNFKRLSGAALDALGRFPGGRTLQVACVYGDLTPRLAARIAADGELHVVDVLPIQLDNLQRKLDPGSPVRLHCRDAADLGFDDASYDRALLFFLLHELPADARRAVLREALRVVRPGGRIVIVDYHRPGVLNPLYLPMAVVLRALEPFALDLWRDPIEHFLPAGVRVRDIRRQTLFGGLYQLVTITR